MKDPVSKIQEPLTIPVPDSLSEKAKRFWADVVPRKISTPGRLLILAEGLACLDRADNLREQLQGHPLAKGCHLAPAAKLEQEQRKLFFKSMIALGLHWDRGGDF